MHRRLFILGALFSLLAGCTSNTSQQRGATLVDAATTDASSPDASPTHSSDTSDTTDTTDTGPPCAAPSGELTFDQHMGVEQVQLEATGFFRTQKLCGRWWFVTPEGHPTWSLGVNDVQPISGAGRQSGRDIYAETVAATYASKEAWADKAAARLARWGFNTAGAWSDIDLMAPRMAVTPTLRLSGTDWQTGVVVDWFSPAWEDRVRQAVEARVTPRADDPQVMGWFLDNEIRWGPDWRGSKTLLELYLDMSADQPGKQVAVDVLLGELGGIDRVNALLGTNFASRQDLLDATSGWGNLHRHEAAGVVTAFLKRAADRYFSTTTRLIRQADPNHLILGNREVSVMTRAEVYQVAARYVDVISINNYTFVGNTAQIAINASGAIDPADGFAKLHALVDLPMMITEFSFRADGSAPPNTYPPIYPTYADQAERADAFAAYARLHQSKSWIVGYHWFRWVDEPVDGRFDGEDSNFGLVGEDDTVYQTLTERMARVNREVFGYLKVPR